LLNKLQINQVWLHCKEVEFGSTDMVKIVELFGGTQMITAVINKFYCNGQVQIIVKKTNVTVRGFNARLLTRSQFASGRSCD
jgi:hypothetical protein